MTPTIVDLSGKSTSEGEAKAKSSAKPKPPTITEDKALTARLAAVFERIAAAAEARGDEELAEIIREDTAVMANGLVSLTRPVRALRAPIVLVLGIVEPVMAFSRVVRVLLGRAIDRRRGEYTEDSPDA